MLLPSLVVPVLLLRTAVPAAKTVDGRVTDWVDAPTMLAVSRERGEDGRWQPYGLYVLTTYRPGTPTPLAMWRHYRGDMAHSGGAWTPRRLTQLGEEQGAVVATPRGRGTSTW